MPRDIPVGNGSLLINFDRYYQLRDLHWPHVGQENHTNGYPCRFGVWVDNIFYWVSEPGWKKTFHYLVNTLVSEVRLENAALQLQLVCNDVVDFHENLYLRRLAVKNLGDKRREVRLFFGHDLRIGGHALGDSSFYEPDMCALLHYKGKRWFLSNVGREKDSACEVGLDQWAVGVKGVGGKVGTWLDAEDGILSGNSVAQGSVDSVVALHLDVPAGEERIGWYWLAVGENFPEVSRLNELVVNRGPNVFLARTRDYWRLWVNKERDGFGSMPPAIADLYRRSLLVLRTQIDNQGAILAANDHDIADFNHDTYSYMWPRDGALVADALVASGHSEISRRFVDFCHKAITWEGFLLHKYNPDGSLASSWHGWYKDGVKELPIQEDETALVLWLLWRHFEQFRDVEFVKGHYRGLIIRAANWLVAYRDETTGLPLSSWDLWEERHGIHAWTVGAVWAGLMAAARFAKAFGEVGPAKVYEDAALALKAGADRFLWREELGRFARMIKPAADGDWQVDPYLDGSMMGLWYFGMYAADDPKIVATMEVVRSRLWVKSEVGGMARYENDYYHQVSKDLKDVPGNPWFICTLWLGQWYIATAQERDDLVPALTILEWAAARTLPSGVMAEQVNPYTNEPMSVSPLTWSHATFVTMVREYQAKEKFLRFPTIR